MLVMQSTSSGMQASTEIIERRNWLYEMWQSWKENGLRKKNDCQTLSSSENPPAGQEKQAETRMRAMTNQTKLPENTKSDELTSPAASLVLYLHTRPVSARHVIPRHGMIDPNDLYIRTIQDGRPRGLALPICFIREQSGESKKKNS